MKKLHRLILYFFGMILYAAGRIKYKRVINGLKPPPGSAGIITTSNHQRDYDIVLLAPALLISWKRWKNIDRLSFVGRDDLFLPSFFSKFYPNILFPVQRSLFHFNLGPLLKYLNAHPMNKLGVRNLHELLINIRDTAGDMPVGEALEKGWEQKYPLIYNSYRKKNGCLNISSCIRYKFIKDLRKSATFNDLSKKIYMQVKNNCVNNVKKTIRDLSELIEDECAIYLPIEDGLTKDGSLMNFKAGLARITENCRNIYLIPLNITYDFMQKGRTTAFLNFGESSKLAPGTPRNMLKTDVTAKILCLQTATMTSLFCHAVTKLVKIDMKNIVSLSELKSMTMKVLEIYRELGHYIDKRLESPRSFLMRLKKTIRWNRKKGLLKRTGTGSDPEFIIDMEKFNEEKPGPFPKVNYINYVLNQSPEVIMDEYLNRS